jgi:hypothetical protein
MSKQAWRQRVQNIIYNSKKEDRAAVLGEPIFVLSMGRTGSTLLMRLMNCVKDVYLFGEHNSAFRYLRRVQAEIAHNAAIQHENGLFILEKNGYEDKFVAWASPFSQMEVADYIRKLLISMYTDKIPPSGGRLVRWGFKEIHYEYEDILFFSKLFPGAQFVFMERDIETQFKSWFAAFYRKRALDRADITAFIHKYLIFAGVVRTFMEFDASRFARVNYEDLQHDAESETRRLLKFANIQAADQDFERIRQVGATRVDYVGDEAKAEDEATARTHSLFCDVMRDLQAKAHGNAREILQASLERIAEREREKWAI